VTDNRIRIVMADDHPIVRKGLRRSIEEFDGIDVVAEAGDGMAALEQIQRLKPDLAILDVDMPKLDGLEVAREMRKLALETRVNLLDASHRRRFFQCSIRGGGQGIHPQRQRFRRYSGGNPCRGIRADVREPRHDSLACK